MDEEPQRDDSTGEPDDPRAAVAAFFKRWWTRVESWRRLMLGGALILLVAAVLRARMGNSFPDSALFASNVGGYLLLALGFAQFFRDRRQK